MLNDQGSLSRLTPLVLCSCLLLLAGCASVPAASPVAKVILLPDEDGKVGAITIQFGDNVREVKEAYGSVATAPVGAGLAETRIMKQSEVLAVYANVLAAQPSKPVSYVLYFGTGSKKLTDDSLAKIPEVMEKIKRRTPTEILIIGHTDTTGTDGINQQLSQVRALAVEQLLKPGAGSANPISIKWHGSHDPLIATPPNVKEPKNRRVEILIL